MPLTGEQLARGVTHLLVAKGVDSLNFSVSARCVRGQPYIKRNLGLWEASLREHVAYGNTVRGAYINLAKQMAVKGMWNA